MRRAIARDPKARASIRALTTRVEALEARIDHPLPPPPEDPAWSTIETIIGLSDWDATLNEGFSGATITETTLPTTSLAALRYHIPGPQSGGDRLEMQRAPAGLEGEVRAYEWPIYIPSSTEFSFVDDDENLISQGHGDKAAGFTSGTAIMAGTEEMKVKVKGGLETSLAGSHRYDYEGEFFFGQLERDRVHTIRHEVLWHRDSGWYRARLDGGDWSGVEDVPTWPIGQLDGIPTEDIMWRLGWYPQTGAVSGDMTMFTGPLVLQEQV